VTVVAIQDQVEAAVKAALTRALPSELAGTDPVVRPSDWADFQANGTLAVAKKAGRAPRDIAAEVAEGLNGLAAEVSGPGFLNLTVPDDVIWSAVGSRLSDERLGVGTPHTGERVVIDYSAPNVAKEMHVGHLRSSVIGDALARVLGHLGADVTRQNHIGDWGTQFGMLIQHLIELGDDPAAISWRGQGARTMSILDDLYKAARARFDTDPEFATRARARVVALQSGDEPTLAVWQDLVAESERAFDVVYARLGLLLQEGDLDGESRYNHTLPGIVDQLLDKGIAVESDGAVVAYSDDVTGPDGAPVPLIVRKQDGGFGYAATDLATIRHRVDEYGADRILYVVDARQALHFRLVFDTARRAGWLPDSVGAEHVAFGTVLGTDGRPFKTRAGDTVRLVDLLDEAENAVHSVLQARDHDFSTDELDAVVEGAAIAAIKYADLSNTRTKDYVFDVDQMVATSGNTGVYLQYAHARVRSILRKLAQSNGPASTATSAAGPVDTTLPLHPAERRLALALDGLDATLRDVAITLEPHRLCVYLYEVATAFTRFYDTCPVLKAEDASRANRVALCELTGRTLATGLDLLGIAAPQRM
jgi:arginyl-tRNA synthetase